MAKILKFPKNAGDASANDDVIAADGVVVGRAGAPVDAEDKKPLPAVVGRALLAVLRQVLFLILRTLRFPICWVLNILALGSGIAFVVIALGLTAPEKTSYLTGLCMACFGSFSLSWYYDKLLAFLQSGERFNYN